VKKIILIGLLALCTVAGGTCNELPDFLSKGLDGYYISPSSNETDFDVYQAGTNQWICYLHPSSSGSYDIYDAHTSRYLGYVDRSGVYILKQFLRK
jgi:hypothetical protein